MSYPAEPQGGNALTRHIGPLPLWGWAGIGILAAVLFYLWNKNRSNRQNSGVNTPGGVNSSLVPQFVNQTYLENIPPPAPSVTGEDHDKDEQKKKEKEDHDKDKDDRRLRGQPLPPAGPGKFRPPNHFRTVTVTKTGWSSTLEGIAKHFDVDSVRELAKLNGIPSTAHLHPGQKIKVPTNG